MFTYSSFHLNPLHFLCAPYGRRRPPRSSRPFAKNHPYHGENSWDIEVYTIYYSLSRVSNLSMIRNRAYFGWFTQTWFQVGASCLTTIQKLPYSGFPWRSHIWTEPELNLLSLEGSTFSKMLIFTCRDIPYHLISKCWLWYKKLPYTSAK